jgi:uncharacterized integral membrane protein
MKPIRQKPKPPLNDRRAERELFFWTAQQSLKLVTCGAAVVYTLISMIEGHVPGLELLLRSL